MLNVHLRSFGAAVDNVRMALPAVAHATIGKRERRLVPEVGIEPARPKEVPFFAVNEAAVA
jgi:hypothetical protein